MRASLTLPLALAACAGTHAMDLNMPGASHFSVSIKSMQATRFTYTMRQQYDFSCGSAALSTLLTHHYNTPVSEAVIFEQMFIAGDQQKIRREGFSLLDMKSFLARRGFKADGFQLPLAKLIEAELPAIVLLSEKGYNHFVVVKGAADGRILLGDPSTGTRAISLERFEAAWPSKLLFVVHGHPGTVAFNGTQDWKAAPLAPVAQGIDRSSLTDLTLPRHGPGEF